ncbi:DUF2510 domain-containing protein [Mycobacterium sp. 2YAF39]|uniref:DUF2510 domain-containing protein n=1 Tax=Mycobacterium sp. 2YAF39 TaxID=3233033 RepID=UPI003F9B20CC
MTSPPPPPRPAPGWYPDPAGGGQRYFDGTNWGPTAPVATAPPPQKKPLGCFKTVLIVIGVIFLIGLIGNSCDDDKKDSSSSTSSSVRSSTPSRTPTTSAGPEKPDASFTTAPGPDGEVVTAAFAIGDNLTEGLIKDGARFETIDILEYAKQVYPNASQVNVRGSFPMKDAYGNVETKVVINITYLKSTIDQINFKGVDKDKIWEIRDSGFIHPEFQP